MAPPTKRRYDTLALTLNSRVFSNFGVFPETDEITTTIISTFVARPKSAILNRFPLRWALSTNPFLK